MRQKQQRERERDRGKNREKRHRRTVSPARVTRNMDFRKRLLCIARPTANLVFLQFSTQLHIR